MRYALIDVETNLVSNVIELEEDHSWTIPEGYFLQECTSAGPGWLWTGTSFEDITEVTPPIDLPITVITKKQARLALLQTGYLDEVEAYVATLPKADQIHWEDSSEFHKDNPVLVAGAAALNLDLDDLFALGATL